MTLSDEELVKRLRDERNFTLTDHQRLLRRGDVDGICDSIDVCFDTSAVARCGPCAIKQAERAGVATDYSLPNSPEVSRLTRALTTSEANLSLAVEALERIDTAFTNATHGNGNPERDLGWTGASDNWGQIFQWFARTTLQRIRGTP